MQGETCGVCMGDGRISNAFGGSPAACPACHGSGRRAENTGFRDVTKTKPSHYKTTAERAAKQTWPTTAAGIALATEVRDSKLGAEVKTRITQEIIDHEGTHGRCTDTFVKKVRKQLRPSG
jgi:hypothetical protein